MKNDDSLMTLRLGAGSPERGEPILVDLLAWTTRTRKVLGIDPDVKLRVTLPVAEVIAPRVKERLGPEAYALAIYERPDGVIEEVEEL